MSVAASLTPEAQALVDRAYEHARALNEIANKLAKMKIATEFTSVEISQIGAPNRETLEVGFKLIISPTRSERVR